MPKVMTRCPRTGTVVATNLSLDRSTFAVIRLEGHNYACSACGERHIWRSEDAWVEEPAPASSPSS
jgi:hypothetical protein